MTQTARYCLDCLLTLTPETASTHEDHFILSIIGFHTGGSPNYEQHHKIAGGTCEKCGRDSVLVYYEVAE